MGRERRHAQVHGAQPELGPALVLHRRPDHGQQPHGRAPRLGPLLQGPLQPLLDHARPQAALPERLRLPGPLDRGRGREGDGLQVEARHRAPRRRRLRRGLQGARAALRLDHDPAVAPSRLLDGLGPQLLHQLGREQLLDLGLPQEVLAEGLALQGPRHHALVPALWHRHLPARDRHRGLPGDHAPLRLPQVPDHGQAGRRANGQGFIVRSS